MEDRYAFISVTTLRKWIADAPANDADYVAWCLDRYEAGDDFSHDDDEDDE